MNIRTYVHTNTRIRTIAIALIASVATIATANAQVVQMRQAANSGYLGISFEEVVQRGEINSDKLIIRAVSKDSPAEKAGVKVSDEIVRINGLRAGDGKFSAIARTLVEGDTVRLGVNRDGKERELTIVAARRPNQIEFRREIMIAPDSVRHLMLRYLDSARVHLDSLRLPSIYISGGDSVIDFRILRKGARGDSTVFFKGDSVMRIFRSRPGEEMRILPRDEIFERELGPGMIFRSMELGARSIGGAEFTELDPAMVDYFKVDHGLLVLRVAHDTPADRAGLEPGDVVVKVKDRAVVRVADLREMVGADPDSVKLEILRKGARKTVELKTRR